MDFQNIATLIQAGAMASSKAPDDNNIVCIGTNAEDMACAINYLAKMEEDKL